MSLEELEKRVYGLGKAFEGRLDADSVNFALGYIKHGELGLAFETLCDYLGEEDVSITKDEYAEIVRLTSDLRADDRGLDYLKKQVRDA
jgi:hypothetical protein